MIVLILKFFFLFHLINGQQRDYNLFMPDLPSTRSPSSSSTTIHVTHSFTKINLFDGPFNVQLYQNNHLNNNYTSVDVETEQSIQNFVSINIERNDILTIRMMKKFLNIDEQINITILIIYRQLDEMYIDGLINIQCLNPIKTNQFRLYNHGTGSMKLKLNVNILDAYFHSIGNVKLCGQVLNDTTIKSLSIGNIDCRNLLTRKINIISSGIGNMYIMAIDEVNITLSGIGSVHYSGPLKQQIKTGLGNIIDLSNNQPIIDEDFD
jgi:hypothetical protein